MWRAWSTRRQGGAGDLLRLAAAPPSRRRLPRRRRARRRFRWSDPAGPHRACGAQIPERQLDQVRCLRRAFPAVALSFLRSLVRRTFEVLRVHRLDGIEKDAEIVVLRHQLQVLQRGTPRPRSTWVDRAFLALAGGLLPHRRWSSLMVTPATVSAWHPKIVRKRQSYPHRGPGRPPVPDEHVELICRLARENPRWGELRIVHLPGVTTDPNGQGVTQVARNLVLDLQGAKRTMCSLIRDRDTKTTAAIDSPPVRRCGDTPYAGAGTAREHVCRTLGGDSPSRLPRPPADLLAPPAGACATDVRRALQRGSPHRGIGLDTPRPTALGDPVGRIERRDVLDGLIHEFRRTA